MQDTRLTGGRARLPLRPYRQHRAWMPNRLLVVVRTPDAIFASRADLVSENLALRQQLAVLQRKNPRPRLLVIDRLLWLALRRGWPRWEEALAIVQLATVMRWHREGFRRYWRWTSRRHAGRPSTTADIRALIHRMAAENPAWGAPRIHGELQKLGLELSERTVSRSMPPAPGPSRRTATMAHLSCQPPRGHRRDRCLYGPHRHFPGALRLLRHPSRATNADPRRCHRAADGGLDHATTPRGVPLRPGAALPDPRP